uniref:ASPSCR1 tether for SLC2A4, UBX domain containing n=1 Tax=Ailuropoda melanoleuca TaxID=9646 RepID=G1MG90_AILME
MVPISRSRQGPENTVRIALQLDDGTRLQDTFCSGQTLWELLSHFAQTVAGRASLQATTLKSLGLTGGSAIIRFAMKPCSSAGVSRSKAPGSPTASLSADQAAGSPLLPLDSAGLSQGDVSHQDEAGISGASRVDAQAKQISKEPAPTPFVPFSGGGQRLGGSSGLAKSLMSPSAKLPKSFSSPGGPSKPKKSKPGQEPRPEPEQERLVDRDPVVCHPDLEELLQAWPTELPDEFFEVTVDDVRRRLAQLRSERKRLEEAPLVTKAFREAQMREKLERYPKVVLRVLFPDRYILQGFFHPNETVGDLHAFVRSHLGNPELPFCLCLFSLGIVGKGWGARCFLAQTSYLFAVITPPKTVLDDPTLTLFQANLFPAALVHFGAEEPTGLFLEPRLLEHTVSPSAADVLVARCMSRAAGTPPPMLAPDPAPLEVEPTAEAEAVGPPEPSTGTAPPVRRDLGKVPKWLKLPASKR